VNSDQTGAQYSAGGQETYAPIGSKQVEVIGKDEKRSSTLMVGISMSGEVLPFQAVYAGTTNRSLPTSSAPNYTKATQELKFLFESSGSDTLVLVNNEDHEKLRHQNPCTMLPIKLPAA
jgi:hypothetical protein